jgi:multimeric flavodoxin WrbA
MKRIIIQGSSKSDGNTSKMVELLNEQLDFDVLDLTLLNIAPFDYDFKNKNDDFLPTLRNIVSQYNMILFATPVYWYAMSGIVKNLFDRITDCIQIEKETGRKLRGMFMAALSCGSDATESEGFFVPFKESAGYLGMNYLGNIHTWKEGAEIKDEVKIRIQEFSKTIQSAN